MIDTSIPRGYSDVLKGLLSLFIVGTHVSAHLVAYTPLWIKLCNVLTPLSLSVFLFLSGYGLMQQQLGVQARGLAYSWSGWLVKRLGKLLRMFFAFYIFSILVLHPPMDLLHTMQQLLTSLAALPNSLLVGKIYPLPQSWFLWALMLLYILYYLSFRWARSYQQALLLLSFATVLLLLFLQALDYPYYWYLFLPSFVLGAAYALYEEPLRIWIGYHPYLSASLLLLSLLVYIEPYVLGAEPPKPTYPLYRLALGVATLLSFPLAHRVQLVHYAQRLLAHSYAAPLQWLGRISMEVYLIHVLFVEGFRRLWVISSDSLYILAVYAASLLSASLIVLLRESLTRRLAFRAS